MREKGHQNWPLVIRLWYDPHLPFSGESISKPWSKWDMSSSNPPLQRMSAPHCPTAITSCEPGSFQTKAWLFLLTNTATEREMQHIYEIIWHLLFHYERENCVSNMWHQKMVWCCSSFLRWGVNLPCYKYAMMQVRKCLNSLNGSAWLLSHKNNNIWWMPNKATEDLPEYCITSCTPICTCYCLADETHKGIKNIAF